MQRVPKLSTQYSGIPLALYYCIRKVSKECDRKKTIAASIDDKPWRALVAKLVAGRLHEIRLCIQIQFSFA